MGGKVQPLEVVLYAIGGIALLWGLWKTMIDGFYRSEMLMIGVVLAIAVAAFVIASRMSAARKRAAAAEADRDRGVE